MARVVVSGTLLLGLILSSACSHKVAPRALHDVRITAPPTATPSDAAPRPAAPSGDSDDDGVLDADDFCVNQPEDLDRCNDEDGCPDDDNDEDRVADVDDRCPNTPGSEKNGGCPLPLPPGTVIIEESDGPCGLVILEPVTFAADDATLNPGADPILEQVAYVMTNCPALLLLELRGVASPDGSEPELAEQRAEAVRSALLARGVPARKLRLSVERMPDAEREQQVYFVVARHLTCPATDH